jgi:transposase-like protein/IS1 family transposase
MKSIKENEKKYKKLSCPICNSKNIIKRGFRKTENRGKIQRYSCKDCSHRFVIDDGFFRMRNHPKKITCALDLFYRGVSTRKVQEHFKAFYPHNSSHKSVYKWVVKYSDMISNFTDKLKINSGKEVQVDEMEYHRRTNSNKKGVSKEWFIDSVDCKTRYIVSSKYFKSRGQKELREVINKVKYKTEGDVTTITTDGYTAYENVVKKTFGWSNKEQKYFIRHNKVTASKGEGFNIMIERLHNSIRERTKTFRGFHGSVESAEGIMKGYEIFYNFIRKYQAIKKCPYELAIPSLILSSENKWLELIRLSKDIISL